MARHQRNAATSLRWALLVLYRERRVFGGVFGGIVAVVLAYSFLVQPVFRAETKLLVTIQRAPLAVSPSSDDRQPPVPQVREEDLNSVVAMLGGRELVRQTLEDLSGAAATADGPSWLGNILRAPVALFRGAYYGLHGSPHPSALDRRVVATAERLQILPVRRSNVVGLAFEDADPIFAAEFLNQFVRVFLGAYARATEPGQAEGFFDRQSALLAGKLHDSEIALQEFRGRAGIVDLDEQRKSVVSALTAAEADLDRVQVDLAASRSRRGAIDRTLPKVQRMVPSARREVHEATSQVRGHLMMLEVKRADLLQKYRDDSIRVRELDEQIRAAKDTLQRAAAAPTQEHEYALNKTFEALEVEGAMESARVDELAARAVALADKVAELRQRALAFDTQALDLERLERERRLDEEVYTSYVQQREAARLSNALNQSQILNLAVAAPATAPVSPVRPRLRSNLAFAVLLGLALGILAAFVRDAAAGGIDFPEDIERASGLDVLGVLPAGR